MTKKIKPAVDQNTFGFDAPSEVPKDLQPVKETAAAASPAESDGPPEIDVELAHGIIGMPCGGLANLETSLGQIKHAVSRAITERDVLYSFMTELRKVIVIVKIRVGILLLFLRAFLPKGEYQIQSAEIFPDFSGRKGRNAKEEAIMFLAARGIKVKSSDAKEVFEALVEEWTITKIIDACGAPKLKSANPPKEELADPSSDGADEAELSTANAKPDESEAKFLRIDTFRQHTKRVGVASAKILTSLKRLNPADYAKAREQIENRVPEPVRDVFLKTLDDLIQPANQNPEDPNEKP